MKSLWEGTASCVCFPKLDSSTETDVLIIGGGITGILCAYMLQQAGIDYILVEANTVCSGITKNTTAKITSQHGLIYDKLISRFGAEKAEQYLDANETAIRKYQEICQTMDCDFEIKDAYVYSLDYREKLINEVIALEKLHYHAKLVNELPLPFSIIGAVKFEHQAQFNPLKFIAGIAPNLHIYEHTKVKELVGLTAMTDGGKISAKRIIVATHFPFLNKHGGYFLKLYQDRSYVIALENAPNVDSMIVDEAHKGKSFRNYQNLLLIGGSDHRTGKNISGWQELRSFATKYYPKAKEKYYWATQDCMSLDQVPYIGPYSGGTQGLYVATGFNKWGMSSSMVAAMILCDMLQNRNNPYAEVFSPSRNILRPQLAINAIEAVSSLVTPTTKRCPHLGCALKWNKYEHTWDCPCHGSRFSQEGELIDNPSTGDLKKCKIQE